MPDVVNVVTTGNGTSTKNVFKWNLALGFECSNQSSVHGATTVVKISLFSTLNQSTISFYSYKSIRLAVNKHRQSSTQTNFLYLGLVNVSMITGT